MTDLSAEALACFARIDQNPQDSAAWCDLLYALAVGPAPEDVWAGLSLLARHNQNRIAHLMVLCCRLAEEGQAAILSRLSDGERLGLDGAFLIVPQYYAARYAYLNGAMDTARTLYERAVAVAPFATGFAGLKPEEVTTVQDLLRRVLFCLLGVQRSDYLDDAATEAEKMPVWPALPDSELLIFAACDDAYCQSYALPFLTAVRQSCPEAAVLIHVMNPTADGDKVRWSLSRDFPNCAFSYESCAVNIPLYAARRFMLAGSLLRHYGRALLILDVDAVLTAEFMQDFPKVHTAELALWRSLSLHSNDSGVYEAVVFAAKDSKTAECFFADATAWYRKTLARQGEFWCWDGYGLHYALSRLGDQQAQVKNLAELWPDLSLGKAVLPQRRQHTVPTMERAYDLFYDVLTEQLPPLLAHDAFRRLTGRTAQV